MFENIHRCLRPFLPVMSYARYNGMLVDIERKPLDWRYARDRDLADRPDYEVALVSSLKGHVRAGDTVVVVGGGLGVTACVAAQLAGPGGRMICFEGNSKGVQQTRRALELNGVAERAQVREAIVAVDAGVYAGEKSDVILPPQSLPDCDILQLDCEGAEIEIIRHMTITPRSVIVETHGFLGASTEQVTQALITRGYSVTNIGPAEPVYLEFCQKNDIMCLIGLKN